ncbi:Prefoldin subunit-domain-containing protein [Jackrogersella minutella]|nr:Prefoldin subunit-domain-containing protein [Jackrogersella minutella]
MASTKDSFLDLERQRQKLEENVARLSKALDYWRQSQKEYRELRETVESLPSEENFFQLPIIHEKLQEIQNQYKGKNLNQKELGIIFGPKAGKTPGQIISLLTNRFEYVSRNVNTLEKQVEEAKNKLAAVTVVANPEATDEEGLPITEIMEELDDDDNVISFSLRTPEDNRPQILETLRKAGVTEFQATPDAKSQPLNPGDVQDAELMRSVGTSSSPTHIPKNSQDAKSPKVPNQPAQQPERQSVEEQPKAKPASKKKSVKFSEDTKPEEQGQQSETAQRLEEILQRARDQQSIISDPIMPADEAPDDAALREDMIRYNKQTMQYEMAPIVAELQLEEGSSEDDPDDYSEEEDDDDDEDELGRTKIKVDDEWKSHMLDLQQRLTNYDFSQNDGSNDQEDLVEGIGRISVKSEGQDAPNVEEESSSNPNTEDYVLAQNAKKTVKFAQSLDIAEASASATAPKQPQQPKHPEVDPVSDVVMERNSGTLQPVAAQVQRASRFRKAKMSGTLSMRTPMALGGNPIAPDKPDMNAKPTPSGPEGKTLASSVLEHESSSEVKEPDEFDADLLQKQATEDYHKLRNKMVHREGGFMKEDENPIQPLDEEEGGPKRVSRFKAAKLAKPGTRSRTHDSSILGNECGS